MAASTSVNRDDAPVPPDESLPRKSSNALLWLLLLLAVLAALWFFYNRSATSVAVAPTATPAIITGDSLKAAAQAEREQANAAASRTTRAERTVRERAAAKPRIADRGPEPIARIQPEYPATAYRNGEEGSVLVRADVAANGTPANVTLVRRSGSRELDRAALEAVREWQFRPAIENGKAVASTVEVPVDFRLAER